MCDSRLPPCRLLLLDGPTGPIPRMVRYGDPVGHRGLGTRLRPRERLPLRPGGSRGEETVTGRYWDDQGLRY